MKRIANYQIDKTVNNLAPFVNYNGTIEGDILITDEAKTYSVWHWSTKILSFNLETGNIDFFNTDYFSQTTSTLQGRLLRNLPKASVAKFLTIYPMTADNQKRLRRMARQ